MGRIGWAAAAALAVCAAGAAQAQDDDWRQAGDTSVFRGARAAAPVRPAPVLRAPSTVRPRATVRTIRPANIQPLAPHVPQAVLAPPEPPAPAAEPDAVTVEEVVVVAAAPRPVAPPTRMARAAPPPPAYAPPGAVVRRTTVRFADLNLDSEPGAWTLLQRIDAAARQVCGPRPLTGLDLREHADWRGCIDGARGGAVMRINAPLVARLYAMRG